MATGRMTRTAPDRVRVTDLRPITQEEFRNAALLIGQCGALAAARQNYVERNGLDPEIFLPAANWSQENNIPGGIWDLYAIVALAEYDVVNCLRWYTQPFTGYQLFTMRPTHDLTRFDRPAADVDQELDGKMTEPDLWLERFHAMTERLPSDLVARPPKMLGEIGWNVDGSPVNHDVCVYQERLALLHESGVIAWLRRKAERQGSVNILEIGGGYGGLAYFLKRIVPQANYILCDLAESLAFSSAYLALTDPDCDQTLYDGTNRALLRETGPGQRQIPHHLFEDLMSTRPRIDLAINTLSFSEMSEKQVRYYAEHLTRMIGETGVLFEQNQDNRHAGYIDAKSCLPDYFACHGEITLPSVPFLSEGRADLWANRASL